MTRTVRWFVWLLMVMTAPGIVAAQTVTPPGARLEVEVYGAMGRLVNAREVSVTLPPAGGPITTSSPFFPSRRVSSWLFGDGAALLNDVNQQLDITARITPLDAAISTIGRSTEPRGSLGARLRIRTVSRVWAELAVDMTSSSAALPDSVAAAVEATRGSFEQAMTSLLASGPFSGTSVTATATQASGSWRDLTATAAANIELGTLAGLTPTVTLGGGLVARVGTQPEVSITGRYTTRILGAVPIDETDRVTIRGVAKTAPAIVIGAGLARAIAGRLWIRLDARMIAANRTVGTSIDARPTVATGTPADFIESFTNPSVQFSNNASTGRQSTLSGDALDHVNVAGGTRLQTRALVTLGIAFRF